MDILDDQLAAVTAAASGKGGWGNANTSDEPDVVDRVWQGMPKAERQQDRDRRGVPVVIDLRQVVAQSRRPDRNFTLRR